MSEFTMFGSLLPSEIPELEPLGLRSEVAMVRAPGSRDRVRALRIYGAGVAEHRALLEALGFRFDRSSGTFLSDGPVDRRRLLLAFPLDLTAPLPGPDDAPPAPQPENPLPAAAAAGLAAAGAKDALFSAPKAARPTASRTAHAVVVGVNADDALVYRNAQGVRFYRTKDGEDVYEDDVNDQAGLFLRAPARGDLPVVARGLLSPALRGRAVPAGEFDRYVAAVNEDRASPMLPVTLLYATYEAVYAVLNDSKTLEQGRALAARLHRFTGSSFEAMREPGQEPFPIFNVRRELAARTLAAFPEPALATNAAVRELVEQNRDAAGAGRTLVDVSGFGDQAPSDQYVRELLGSLPAEYVLEGAQVIAPPLVTETKLLISIGDRRPQAVDMAKIPASAFQVGYTSEPEGLNGWLEGVASANAAATQWFEAIRRGEVKADTVEVIEQNRWQVPARPLSKVGRPTMMTPVNLKGALEEAQANFLARHPEGVDEYVARVLRRPASSLGQVFLPEQIDTIAFDLDAEERKRGFLVGNLTGTGKGRIAAARVQVCKLQNKRVIVLTERTVGLGTLARDLINIGAMGSQGSGLRLALLNAGNDLREAATGSVIFPKQTAKQVEARFMPDGKPVWPEGVDVVMGTYSGFNRDLDASWRTAWLEAIVNKETYLVLDEAHNVASAESKSAENIVNAIAAAGHTMYLTATYAPSGDKTGPYFSLIAPNATAGLAEVLPQTISNGGEAAHEEFGNLLVRDGAMVRFEHSFEEIDFRLKVSPNVEQNRAKLDELAPILRELLAYVKVVQRAVAVANVTHIAGLKTRFDAQRDQFEARIAGAEGREPRAILRNEWERVRKNGTFRAMSFGSPLYRIQRAFNAAVMVSDDQGIISNAIDHLRNGRKPIIVVDQTSEATIREVREMAADLGIDTPIPGFKHLLQQVLKTMGNAVNQNAERLDVAVVQDRSIQLREMAAGIVDGLCEAAQESAQAGAFTQEIVGKTKGPKPAELLRDWFDAVMPATLSASFDALIQTRGEDLSGAERSTIKGIVAVSVEDAFLTVASDPVEIIQNLRQLANELTDTVDVAAARQSVSQMIDALPDLPISFIDVVKQSLQKEGYRVGEITGRQTSVDQNGNIVRREREEVSVVRDKFNGGQYDAAVLNSAGASMIDMHSSAEFVDQRQRVLMILQLPPASTLVQTLGRVHRIGQVIPPIVEMHINGMPTEVRFLANLNMNLARMNANLASIRRHPLMCEAVPPLLTRDGDVATARFLVANPKMVESLGLDISAAYLEKVANPEGASEDQEDDVDALDDGIGKRAASRSKAKSAGIKSFARLDNRRLANEVLSRSSILPAAGQSELLAEIQASYYARIEEREALGLDTVGVRMVEGKVTVRARRTLDLGDGAKAAHEQSAFRAPLSLALLTIEQPVAPMRGRDVLAMITRSINKGEDRALAERVAFFERLAQGYMNDVGGDGVLGELAGLQMDRTAMRCQIMRSLTIGGGLTARHDGELLHGVIVGFRDQNFDPVFEVALPGLGKTKMITLSSIQMLRSHEVWAGMTGQRRSTLKMFDDAGELSKVEPRMALTGNNWAAVQYRAGKIVTWENGDGTTTRGVLIPKSTKFRPEQVIRFTDVDQYARVVGNLEPGSNYHVALPVMPWAGSGSDGGMHIGIDLRRLLRRGNTEYTATFNLYGHSTVEGAGRRSWASVSEVHLNQMLSAGGGLIRQVFGDEAVAGIHNQFAKVRAIRDSRADAEMIQDPARRNSERRRARAAAKMLVEGVPIDIKQAVVSSPELDGVLENVKGVLRSAFENGLEATRTADASINIKAKEVRNWLINGGRRPADLDAYVEITPPPTLVRTPANEPFAEPAAAPAKSPEAKPAEPVPTIAQLPAGDNALTPFTHGGLTNG